MRTPWTGSREKSRAFPTSALHFGPLSASRSAHARCTEIYLSRYRRGGNRPPPLPLLLTNTRSFSPLFPRSRSQILTYDYVGGASARISPESRRGRRNGFANLRGHRAAATVGIRNRARGFKRERESREDKRGREEERHRERYQSEREGDRNTRWRWT